MSAANVGLTHQVKMLKQQVDQLNADNLSQKTQTETWRRAANELQDQLTHARSRSFAIAANLAAEEREIYLKAAKSIVPPAILTYNQARAYAAQVIETKLRALQ